MLAVEIPQAGILKRIHILPDDTTETSEVALPAVDVGEGDWLAINFRLPDLAGPLSQYELLTTLGNRFKRIWV